MNVTKIKRKINKMRKQTRKQTRKGMKQTYAVVQYENRDLSNKPEIRMLQKINKKGA